MAAILLSLFKYWKPLAISLAVVVTFFAGVKYESGVCEVEKQKLIAEYTQMIQEEVDRRYELSVQYEERLAEMRAQSHETVKQVEVEIVKPIYRDCKVPETGIKLLNETINKLNNLRKE